MEQEEQKQNDITMFVKIGILVLTLIVLAGLAVKYLPDAVTVSSNGNRRDLPIYCVDTNEKKVALTFETAWGNEDIKKILNILAKNNVKATFFMTGEWVMKYPEDVKAIAAAGHDIGNHSETHKQMSQLSKKQCIQEIMNTHNQVMKLTGIKMNLFRAPYGSYSDNLVETARELNYYTIQWDVDSFDWKDYGVNDIIERCTEDKNLGKGSIILMHNGAKYTSQALEGVIIGLKGKGYNLVPISQLIFKEQYTVDNTGRQSQK